MQDILHIKLTTSNWFECQKTVLEKFIEIDPQLSNEQKIDRLKQLSNFNGDTSWDSWFAYIGGELAEIGYDKTYIESCKKDGVYPSNEKYMNYFVKLVIIEHLVPLDLSEEDMKIYSDFARDMYLHLDISEFKYNLLILFSN